jgi:hypothetical protein
LGAGGFVATLLLAGGTEPFVAVLIIIILPYAQVHTQVGVNEQIGLFVD